MTHGTRRWAGVGLALLGALLLLVPATRLRVDRLTCARWPSAAEELWRWGAYALSVALLTVGWGLVVRRAQGLGLLRILLGGAVVHACALLAPPFLSSDVLFYAAIGRAQGVFHHSAHELLYRVLPAGDRFLVMLPDEWQRGNSAYGPLFNRLAALLGALAGDDLGLSQRLFQGVGATAALLAAYVAGRALGPRAAALIMYCPLVVIEATVSGHNDSLLLLLTAAAVAALARGRPWAGLGLLGLGLLIKLSAVLMPGFLLLVLLWSRLTRARRGLWALAGLGVAGLVLGLLAWRAMRGTGATWTLLHLLGQTGVDTEFCTRSLECLPRAVLRWLFGWPQAAGVVGLLVRALAAAWLWRTVAQTATRVRGATGAAAGQELLRGAARFLFVYYWLLHAYVQPWYLLVLVPLLPYAAPDLRWAMAAYVVAGAAYYPVDLPFDCDLSHPTVAFSELAGIFVLVGIPLLVLRWRRRRAAQR